MIPLFWKRPSKTILLLLLLFACSKDPANSQDRFIPIQEDMLHPDSRQCKSPCQYKLKNGTALDGNFTIELQGRGYFVGTLRNGFMQGIVEFFAANRKLIRKTEYCNGNYCGIHEEYSYEGRKQSTSFYNDAHKLEGVRTIYGNLDGSLSETIEYKNGVMHGKRTFYYSDGKPQYITDYAGGKKHGEEINYYEKTGKIKSIRYFKDGIEDGKITTYFPTGEVEQEMWLKDGKKNGKNILYNASSGKITLWIERHYKDDLRHGRYTEFDLYKEPGVVLRETYYWNDAEVSKEEFEKRSATH
jgi:antitoxin component YwqK of YwqJK toxin-antitoxin module